MTLTETSVSRAKTKAAAYQMTDGGGLFLLVTASGGKLWRWKYRHGGKQKQMGLGQWPDVPLPVARELHARGRRLLASGVDPMVQRKAERREVAVAEGSSFATVTGLWLAHWATGKSRRHVDTTARRLETNVLPLLGARPIADIEPLDLVRMVKAIEARGVGDLAKRALETTGQIFRFAIAHGYTTRNPCSDIKPSDVLKPTTKVNYARVSAKDLPELLRAIEVYRGKPVTRLALKLLALVFVRTSELLGARWSEFDLPARRWNIPAARMKARTSHVVPLSKQTLELLGLLRGLTGHGELLFPGDRDSSRPMSNMTILVALKRMGYGPGSAHPHTGHGFRGLASTILHEQGFDHSHIELQLAHTQRNAVSAAYNHALYLQPRAVLMQAWADYLERTLRTSP